MKRKPSKKIRPIKKDDAFAKAERRKKINQRLATWKRARELEKIAAKQRESIRRKKISESLRAYHATGKTKVQRERIAKREARKKLPKLPKKVSKDPRSSIQTMLETAGAITGGEHGTDHDVRGHANKDGSASYELRFAIPKKNSSVDGITSLLITLANALQPITGTWISIGFRFQPDAAIKEEDYDRYRGLHQVQAHSQRNTARKILTNMQGADFVQRHMKENRRKRPEQVFVRIHWDPEGKRPE